MGRKPILKSERNPDIQLNSHMEEEDILHYMGKTVIRTRVNVMGWREIRLVSVTL